MFSVTPDRPGIPFDPSDGHIIKCMFIYKEGQSNKTFFMCRRFSKIRKILWILNVIACVYRVYHEIKHFACERVFFLTQSKIQYQWITSIIPHVITLLLDAQNNLSHKQNVLFHSLPRIKKGALVFKNRLTGQKCFKNEFSTWLKNVL